MLNIQDLLKSLEYHFESIMQERHLSGVGVGLGTYTMGRNPDLSILILNHVLTENSKFDTFKIFKRRHRITQKKPTKPIPDPKFEMIRKQDRLGWGKQRDLFNRLSYEYAHKELEYEKALANYERDEQLQIVALRYDKNEEGYIQYIRDAIGPSNELFFDKPRHLYIPEEPRKHNSYIFGAPGSGKSEVAKLLIHHNILKDQSASVIIIDPHGRLSLQTANSKDFITNKRLVYIEPGISSNLTPAINPFEIYDKSPDSIDSATDNLITVFGEIIKNEFSDNMKMLMRVCIKTLLMMGDCTIEDLVKFLDKKDSQLYFKYAMENLELETDKYFLENTFYDSSLIQTKTSIKTRLQFFLGDRVFNRFLTFPKTFDLKDEIDNRSIIVFNLARDKGGMIGMFIIGMIRSIALARKSIKVKNLVPTYVYIDEAPIYLETSESIEISLNQARKFRVHSNIITQSFGQGMNLQTRKSISNSTDIKMVGAGSSENFKAYRTETNTRMSVLNSLGEYEWCINFRKWDPENIPSIVIAPYSHIIDDSHSMSQEQWEIVKKEQIEKYYVPIKTRTYDKPKESLSDKNRNPKSGWTV